MRFIARADAALYRSKQEGRDRVSFSQSSLGLARDTAALAGQVLRDVAGHVANCLYGCLQFLRGAAVLLGPVPQFGVLVDVDPHPVLHFGLSLVVGHRFPSRNGSELAVCKGYFGAVAACREADEWWS